jgi:histidinol-phosphatase
MASGGLPGFAARAFIGPTFESPESVACAGQDGTVDDLELARRAALVGGDVALRYARTLAELPRELKADGSVVTAADRAVEAAIRDVLTGERPGDAILGEEGGQTGDAGRRWIIDPIDGTALFVAGDDRWLVLIALEEAGEIVAAVAAIPAQGVTFWAARDSGAYTGGRDLAAGRRIAVDPGGPDAVAESRLGVLPAVTELQAPLLALTRELSWRLHPGLLVALGELDLAVQTGGELWDFAATSLIVIEAGGSYSGMAGNIRPSRGASLYARSEKLRLAALEVLAPQTPAHSSRP